MKVRLTEADMLNLADQIMDLPLHIEIDIGSEKYLLAHAMTFAPLYGEQEETMYLEGIAEMQKYWQYGIKGYVSLIGHHDSGYQYNNPYGSYLDDKLNSIWVNEPENVYMVGQYGIKGYVSLIGHHDSGYQYNNPYGSYLDDKLNSIWVNEPENVYMVACGCGLPNGRLAGICLETGERFYS